VTLEDLAAMVKDGEDFLVYDAKTGDDITRSVLAQIIFEQENKAGQNLLPTTFLRQLIRFYGDSMQMVVPKYLEQSIDTLTREQEKFRKQLTNTFSGTRLLHSKSMSAATWNCSSRRFRCSSRSYRRAVA
jgi:polyhydroxyalkanoate synthesis repressor PhaR